MIEKLDYHNELARAKALLEFQKEDLKKYAANPKAQPYGLKIKQEAITVLENFILSAACYVSELESLSFPITDKAQKVVHLYHYPKDEDTIRCLGITHALLSFNRGN